MTRAMIRWICHVKPEENAAFELLPNLLNIRDLTDILQTHRFRWLSHVECSTGWISQVHTLNVIGHRAPSRPKLSLDDTEKRDCESLRKDGTNPQDYQAWRGKLRS